MVKKLLQLVFATTSNLQSLGFQITIDANFEEETHSKVIEF